MRNQAAENVNLPLLLSEEKRTRVPENVLYMVRKCKCGSPQCPECQFISWVPKETKIIQSYRWRQTREITLTPDPSLFNSPGECLKYVKDNKLISRFIWNIQRGRTSTRGAVGNQLFTPFKVLRWRVHQEFTGKGWPHWHILLEVQETGKAGMIGIDRIRHYWKIGKVVWESPIKSKAHWIRKVGDFQKLGYWTEDKQYQTELPEWARQLPTKSIRRAGGSAIKKSPIIQAEPGGYNEPTISLEVALMVEILQYLYPKPIPLIKTYGEILDGCGKKVWIRLLTEKVITEAIYDIQYSDIRGDKTGTYFEKIGYVIRGDIWDVERLLGKIDISLRVLSLKDSDWKYDRSNPEHYSWLSNRGERYG